jgi:hypothetical protein
MATDGRAATRRLKTAGDWPKISQHQRGLAAAGVIVDYLLEILRHQPMMITAGGLLAVLQFTATRFRARQFVQKRQQLRDRVIALNAFVASMKEVSEACDSHAACLQDALRERDLVLRQLAACGHKPSQRLFSRNAAQRLFLMYPASSAAGWLLHWAFFTLVATTIAGTVHGLLHMGHLPLRIRVLFLICTSVLAVLVRLAAIHVEGTKVEKRILHEPERVPG